MSQTNLHGQTEGSNQLQTVEPTCADRLKVPTYYSQSFFLYKIGISMFLPFVDQHQNFGNREVPTCQLFHHDSSSPEELLFFFCFFFFFFLSSSSSCDDALSDLLFFLFFFFEVSSSSSPFFFFNFFPLGSSMFLFFLLVLLFFPFAVFGEELARFWAV